MRGPLIRCDGDAARQAPAGFAITRERFKRCELAHIQIFAWAPKLALNFAFHKRDQARLHLAARFIRNAECRIHTRGFVRGCQQVCGEHIAAAIGLALARREIIG